MKKLFQIIIPFFLIFNCTPKNQVDYQKQNERFDFSSDNNLIKSIELHLKKFENDQAILNLNAINFTDDCEQNFYELIANKAYENFIETNPQEFLCFIKYLNKLNQVTDTEEIYYNSSQAFLRNLTPLKLL